MKTYFNERVFPNKNDFNHEKGISATVWNVTIKSSYETFNVRDKSPVYIQHEQGVIFHHGKFIPVWRRVEYNAKLNRVYSHKYSDWSFDDSRKI